MEAGAGVAWPGWLRQRVVKQMEHHTGADETAEAGTGSAGTGSAGIGSAGTGSAGIGPASTGPGEPAMDPGQVPAWRETGAPDGAAEMQVAATGQPRVDAALRLLDRLPGLPVSEHPELFEQVHAQLSEVLGELDSGPSGPVGLAGG